MKIYNVIFYFLIFDLISSLKTEDSCLKNKFKNCELVQCSRKFCYNAVKTCKLVTWTKFVGKSKVTYLSGEKYKLF